MSARVTEDKMKVKCTARIGAVQTYTPAGQPITIDGQQYPAASIIALYQACLDQRTALAGFEAEAKTALTARRAADKAANAIEKGLRSYVNTTFGPTSKAAIAYGFAPKEPVPPKAAVKAEAQKKAKATREARGVIGKNKRKAVKAAPQSGPTPKS